jgi:CheY-like chemotaxis protein
MAAVALVSDLLFESKITATARALGATVVVVRAVEAATAKLGGASGLVVDLNSDGGDALALIRTARAKQPELSIVAFVSHIQVDLARAARAAGADEVLARSAFVQRLPEILGRLGGATGESPDEDGRAE